MNHESFKIGNFNSDAGIPCIFYSLGYTSESDYVTIKSFIYSDTTLPMVWICKKLFL